MGLRPARRRSNQSMESKCAFPVSFFLDPIQSPSNETANSAIRIGPNKIPTWTTPLFALIFITALIPNTSFLGHLCALGIGYVC